MFLLLAPGHQAERRAAKTIANFLRNYPEITRVRLEPAGYMVVQTVECLTHRFAAHPDEQLVSSESFVVELVAMVVSCPLPVKRSMLSQQVNALETGNG